MYIPYMRKIQFKVHTDQIRIVFQYPVKENHELKSLVNNKIHLLQTFQGTIFSRQTSVILSM